MKTKIFHFFFLDIQDPKISVESNKLTFSGVSHGVKYHNELEFTGEIDPSVRNFLKSIKKKLIFFFF